MNICVPVSVSVSLFKLKDAHSLHLLIHSAPFTCQGVCYVLGLEPSMAQERCPTSGLVHFTGGEKQWARKQINKQGNCRRWQVLWNGHGATTEQSSWRRKEKWDLRQDDQCVSQGSPEKEDQGMCVYRESFILRNWFMQLWWWASLESAGSASRLKSQETGSVAVQAQRLSTDKTVSCLGRSVFVLGRPLTD